MRSVAAGLAWRGIAAAMLLAGVAATPAEPEPWVLGEDNDRVAVVAGAPGDEALHCAGLLQECAGLDVPVQVFFRRGTRGDAAAVAQVAELFGLSPDAFDLASSQSQDLSTMLAAFAPSHVVVANPDNETLASLELAFADPGRAPLVLLPAVPGAPDAALALTLPPYQTDARAAAAGLYGFEAPGGDSEEYLAFEIDDLAAIPLSESAQAAVPPARPETVPAAVAPAPAAPAAGTGLRPRTRLPSAPANPKKPKARPRPQPDPSSWGEWFDEPVRW